jgi:hypothetical protein
LPILLFINLFMKLVWIAFILAYLSRSLLIPFIPLIHILTIPNCLNLAESTTFYPNLDLIVPPISFSFSKNSLICLS